MQQNNQKIECLTQHEDIAIVTGSSGNIGAAITQRLIEDGYFVYGLDVKPPINMFDPAYYSYIRCDLCDHNDIKMSIIEIKNVHPRISVLVNNAGISSSARVHDLSEDEWFNVMNVNLNAVFYLSKRVVEEMKLTHGGRIINIGSVDGIAKNNNAAYATSKAGLLRFTEVLAKSYGKYAIRCNSVIPGFIDTNMLHQHYNQQTLDNILQNIPLRRLGLSSEIASVVSYLCSADASYITGSHIKVDGGYLL
jgi:NAD(P)-dependent dehydrogenase (short-subunit alcohol dehydrogenase family)